MDEAFLSNVRLSIVAELSAADWISFSELQRAIGATNGNLSVHMGKLLATGYVEERKAIVGRRPLTRYRLTRAGRSAFAKHVRDLQSIVDNTKHR